MMDDRFVANEYIHSLSMGSEEGWKGVAKQYYKDHPEEFVIDGIKKPLDEKTESEIVSRLQRNERERIVRDLRQNATIRRVGADDR